ncbi:MAG: DUF1800 domain-containing protein [Actinomycetota bacterium]
MGEAQVLDGEPIVDDREEPRGEEATPEGVHRRTVLGIIAAGAVLAACGETKDAVVAPNGGVDGAVGASDDAAGAVQALLDGDGEVAPITDTGADLGQVSLPVRETTPVDAGSGAIGESSPGAGATSTDGGSSADAGRPAPGASPTPAVSATTGVPATTVAPPTTAAPPSTTTTTAALTSTTAIGPSTSTTNSAPTSTAPALPVTSAETRPPTSLRPAPGDTTSTTAAPTTAPPTTAPVETAAPRPAPPETTVAPPETTTTTAPQKTTTTAAPPETTTTTAKEPPPTAPPTPTTLTAETVVAKLTFGATPGQLAQVRRTGPQAFIDDQLRRVVPDGQIEQQVREIKPIHMSPKELSDNRIRNWWMHNYTGHIALYRASRSRNQLYEMMCQLWMDHFNVFLVDNDQYFIPDYQENVIRRHAMGSFAELLKATAHAPAMLRYLNNDVSDASSPDGINENYGRELLELHSLGIDRNNRQIYDQQDVENASMVMGGWSTERNRNNDNYGRFVYRPEYEYGGPDLTLLNGTWSTAGLSGKARGDSLLDFLARHPTTAHHIAYKICRRFVSDEPSDALVNSTAKVFADNDTAIVPTLRHVFTSAEFAASGGRKARRPLEFQAAVLRATSTTFSNVGEDMSFRRLGGYYLQPAGHEPWMWGTPDGYPDYASHWIVADALIKRWNHGIQVAESRIGGVSTDIQPLLKAAGGGTASELVQGLADQLGLGPLPDDVVAANLKAIGHTPDQARSELKLDDRRFGTLTGLLMAHPLFQIR